MNTEQFQEAVLIHGADVHRWPEDIRQTGLDALACSLECRAVREDYARLESVMASRKVETPRPDFARRIIAAAHPRERSAFPGVMEFLASCFRDLRVPAPVATVTAVLLVGFVVGVLLPTESTQAESELVEAQTFLDSATEAL